MQLLGLKLSSLLVPLMLAVAEPGSVSEFHDNGVKSLAEYFDLLVSGNYESAEQYWTPQALERSRRFGIEYTDVPLKVDAGSPIVRDIPLMRDYLHPTVKLITELDSTFNRLHYSALVVGNLVEYDYYAYLDGGYYWLSYPQDFFGRNWPITETEYFRIHADPGAPKQLNPVALEEADQFIETMASRLRLPKDDLKLLREQKIEYYYCANDSLVGEVIGHRVKGTYDLASNDIISAFFPHYHELCHLLVNLKLKRLPIFTQPLFREGLATQLGGRWGKSPETLSQLGAFLYREQIVQIDSLLTMVDFQRNSSADIAYPVAGLISAFFEEQLGLERYLAFYLEMSGSFEEVHGMARVDVQDAIVKATGHDDWSAFLASLDEYINRVLDEEAALRPGLMEGGKEIASGDDFKVTARGDWLALEFTRSQGTPVTGNLVFGLEPRLIGGGSELFGTQYQGAQAFEGYRYGIRYDQNEIGLYDYATDILMAKFIWGIDPSDDYFHVDRNAITVILSADLVDRDLLRSKDIKLLDN